MSESKQPCDLHTWQPVALPDGRTVILCGKCGEHALTLPTDALTGQTVPPAVPYPMPYPVPYVPYTPYLPTMPPYPVIYRITTTDSANGTFFDNELSKGCIFGAALQQEPLYSIADMMSGTSAPGSGIRLT